MKPIKLVQAPVVQGRSRGRRIGIPTINVEPSAAPKELSHGIYACWITVSGKRYRGAMHFGPRPAFDDTETLEVHILDELITEVPKTVDLEVVKRLRDVENFSNTKELVARINQDISETRAILEA